MSFAVRGVIEGFYRRLWTDAERGRVIDALGAIGFTTYAYAPKEEPYQNREWRRPYPPEQRRSIERCADACASAGLELWIGLRPVGISYADPLDLERLVAKLRVHLELGATRLILLADDIPSELDSDRAGPFAALADAHVALVNDVARQLGPDVPLVFVPTDYHGSGSPYLERIGAGLPPEVAICWTGSGVFASSITVDEAEEIASVLRRPPLIWDNYPVNDEPDRHDLRIGPIRGREPALADATAGILVNPALEPEAGLIPLRTWAEFLNDPAAYDPDAAFGRAVAALAGNDRDAHTVATIAAAFDRSVLDQGWERPSDAEIADALTALGTIENEGLRKDLQALIGA